jgi:hypothetical protein
MRKKIKKLIKLKKSEKNNWKNRIVKKNWLEFLKNRPVRFYKPETKKTELKPDKTKKKLKNWKNQTKPIWICFCSKITELKPVGLNRFQFVFFLKTSLVIFFNKNQIKPNWSKNNHPKTHAPVSNYTHAIMVDNFQR